MNSKVMPEPYELYQVIKGLPAGKYRVGCRMANFIDLISTQRLFANNSVTYFGSADDYDMNLTEGEINSFAGHVPTEKAELQKMSVEVMLKDGEELRIGVRSGNKLKDGSTAPDNAGWFKVDDFTLEYIDGDVTEVESLRQDVVAFHEIVDVYNINGIKVRNKAKASEALDGLKNGLYIIGGRKVAK